MAGLLTAATAGVLSIAARAQNQPPPAAGAEKDLEGLLKELGINNYTCKEGVYRFPLEIGDGEAIMIGAREIQMYKDRRTGQEVKIVWLWCNVATLPEGFKPSLAMLQWMAQFNDNLYIGNVGLGGRSINYNSSFWLRTADKQVLADHLQLAALIRSKLREELLPYIKE